MNSLPGEGEISWWRSFMRALRQAAAELDRDAELLVDAEVTERELTNGR